jgi:hypothetical protein
MESTDFLVEVTTVQGAALRFGPYSSELAQRVADELRPRIGADGMVFSPAIDGAGRPAGAWAIAGRGISAVRVVPSSATGRSSGRLQRPHWRS